MIELLKEATADAEEETYFCFYQVQQADWNWPWGHQPFMLVYGTEGQW